MPPPPIADSTCRNKTRPSFWRKPLGHSIATALTVTVILAVAAEANQLNFIPSSGSWDSTSPNWLDSSGLLPPQAWVSGDEADFTTPSTVTVTGTQVADTVYVNEGSTFSGWTISLFQLSVSNNVANGQPVTINSNLTDRGQGMLINMATDTEQVILTGTTTVTGIGGTGISRGTVVVQGASASFQMGPALTMGGANVTANLNITSGASASTGGNASIATNAGSFGNLTLTGAGSSFLAGGQLDRRRRRHGHFDGQRGHHRHRARSPHDRQSSRKHRNCDRLQRGHPGFGWVVRRQRQCHPAGHRIGRHLALHRRFQHQWGHSFPGNGRRDGRGHRQQRL